MTKTAQTLRQPIKRHGGKHYLAPWIISLMPPHLHYVEPYFGGGAVLLARDPNRNWLIDDAWHLQKGDKVPAHLKGCSEVVNDIDGELANFWKYLQDTELFAEFQRLVSVTPFSEYEFDNAEYAAGDNLSRAVKFFVRNRQSRQALGKDFATLTRNRTRGGRNEQVNAWLSAIEGLPEIHERLRDVVVLDRDAIDVIRQQDGEHTLYYCDPPYLHETRTSTGEYGEHEMTPEQHEKLLATLACVRGKFMLSGYHSRLYDDWAAANCYRCHEIEIDNKASSAKSKEKKTECAWTNY